MSKKLSLNVIYFWRCRKENLALIGGSERKKFESLAAMVGQYESNGSGRMRFVSCRFRSSGMWRYVMGFQRNSLVHS